MLIATWAEEPCPEVFRKPICRQSFFVVMVFEPGRNTKEEEDACSASVEAGPSHSEKHPKPAPPSL